MPSPTSPHTTAASRGGLRPLSAFAVCLLLGCTPTTTYAPAILAPRPADSAGQPKTAIDGLEGRPIGLTNQEPIPVDEAASAPTADGSAVNALIPKAPPELAASAAAAAAAALPPGEKFDENNAIHRLARCRAHVARSEWFDAIGDCRKAAELEPKSAEPYVELMRIYVTIQSYADGAEAARAVLAREPDSAPAYYYLGWSLSKGQEYQPSIEAFRRAVSIDPERVEYQQGLGITYCLAENFAKGIAALEEAQRLAPDNAKTAALLSETRALLAERLAPHQKTVKAKPGEPAAHAALGSHLQRFGFSEKALAEYDSALTKIASPLADQDADTRRLAAALHYNRGVLYRDLGRGDAATPAFAKSFEIDPSLAPQAWYFIGLIAYDKGDLDGAIRALGRSVQGAPEVVENRTALALAYEKSGRSAEAKEQRDAVARLERKAAQARKAPAEAQAEAPAGAPQSVLQPEAPSGDPADSPAGAE